MRRPGVTHLLATALLGLALLFAAPLRAAPVELDPERQPQRLLAGADTWIDASGGSPIEQVARDGSLPWQPLGEDTIYPLARGKALWVRFTLRTEANPVGERWYLEVPYPAVDSVTLFTPDAAGRWNASSAGDQLPVTEWPVPHRHPLLPLATRSGGTRTLYVRIENSHTFSAPLQFITESHQSLSEQRIALLLGFYFGLVALTIALSALSAATLRDRAFGLYALMAAAMGMTQAGMTGISGMHLWPGMPWWNDVAQFIFPVLATGLMCGFIAAVISLKDRSRWLYAMLIGLGLLALPVVLALLAVDPSQRYRLMLPYVVAAIPALLSTLLWALSRGDRYAGWVLAATVPVAIGAAFPLARTAGLIPSSALTMHSMQFALAVQLPALLVMLLHRSQQRRDYTRRMQTLDRLDPATGLLNAAVFHERLGRLIARSVRLKYRSAILLVEITNLEEIRRDFDRNAAQELPLRVAGRLLTAGREIDSVARLSDHRFGLLLEGPLKAEEVAEAAPRVVARCLLPFENRPAGWEAKVRVAQGLIPKDGTDAEELMAKLEELLESASDNKREVFMLSKPNLPLAMPLTP
jgi:GGDEF domain-containing protein